MYSEAGDTSVLLALTDKERVCCDCLARGKTVTYTAKVTNVPESTIYKWKSKSHIKLAINELQSQYINEGGGATLSVIPLAFANLTEIMVDTSNRPSDRIQAARVLINSAQHYEQRKLLESTIGELEQQLYGKETKELRESTLLAEVVHADRTTITDENWQFDGDEDDLQNVLDSIRGEH